MTSIISRLSRGWERLKNGTLTARIAEIRRARRTQRRLAWWKKREGQSGYVTTEVQPGVQMQLYFDSHLARRIYRGDFEWRERQFFNRLLRAGDVFIDAGANIGLFTTLAAYRVGVRGEVYAFEPCASTFQRLQDNLALNQFTNTRSFRVGLSSQPAELEMKILPNGGDAQNSLGRPISGDKFDVEQISCITLDDFVREHGLQARATVMKVDVEGWETHLLQGAKNFLSDAQAPTLLIEFNDRAAEGAGSSCAELRELLDAFGYQLFRYDAVTNRLQIETPQPEYFSDNLVATKQADWVNQRLADNKHK